MEEFPAASRHPITRGDAIKLLVINNNRNLRIIGSEYLDDLKIMEMMVDDEGDKEPTLI